MFVCLHRACGELRPHPLIEGEVGERGTASTLHLRPPVQRSGIPRPRAQVQSHTGFPGGQDRAVAETPTTCTQSCVHRPLPSVMQQRYVLLKEELAMRREKTKGNTAIPQEVMRKKNPKFPHLQEFE